LGPQPERLQRASQLPLYRVPPAFRLRERKGDASQYRGGLRPILSGGANSRPCDRCYLKTAGCPCHGVGKRSSFIIAKSMMYGIGIPDDFAPLIICRYAPTTSPLKQERNKSSC